MTPLEDCYRNLFRAYPADYRAQREEEMVSALLDAASPSRSWPRAVEAVSLVANGLSVRVRSAREWNAAVTGAGVVALALASMLAVGALGLALLPSTPDWRRAGIWALALVVVALGAFAARPWIRLAPVVLAPVVVVGGAELMGPRRWYLVAFTLLAVMSAGGAASSLRPRLVSVGLGAAAGIALVARLVARLGAEEYRGRTVHTWDVVGRWNLTQELVPLGIAAWVTLALVGLVAGIVRPRLAIGAGLIVVPLSLLVPSDRPTPASAIGGLAALLGLALVATIRQRVAWTG